MSHEQMIESLEKIIDNISIVDCIPYSERKLRAHILLANLYADNGEYFKSFIHEVRAMSEHNNIFCNYTMQLIEYVYHPSLFNKAHLINTKDMVTSYSRKCKKVIDKWPNNESFSGVKIDMVQGFDEVEKNLSYKPEKLVSYLVCKTHLNN